MESDRERSIKKLDKELCKDIRQLVQLAKLSTYMELFLFIYLLRSIRIVRTFRGDFPVVSDAVAHSYFPLLEFSLKYLIQFCLKYGKKGFVVSKKSKKFIQNHELSDCMMKLANHISTKHESKSLIQMCQVKVHGERDQYTEVTLFNTQENSEEKMLFDYFIRIEKDNLVKCTDLLEIDDYFHRLNEEHQSNVDLFEATFGIELRAFIDLFKSLLLKISNRLRVAEETFARLPNGNIDALNLETCLKYIKCCTVKLEDVRNEFGVDIQNIINQMSFDINTFDETELRYHRLTRQPIIKFGNDAIIISPEILMDSLFFNIHYTLLENIDRVKDEYKKRYAVSVKATPRILLYLDLR